MCKLSSCPSEGKHAGIIYGLHNGDGRYRYIGLTTDPNPVHYLSLHRSRSKRGLNRPVYHWMTKYGASNIQMDIIEDVHSDMVAILGSLEILYIKMYRDIGLADMNVTAGGDGLNGMPFTEDHKQKISKALTGKVRSAEHSAAISAAKKGATAWNKGTTVPDNHRLKDSEYQRQNSMKGNHSRWHVNHPKGPRVKPDCSFCMV